MRILHVQHLVVVWRRGEALDALAYPLTSPQMWSAAAFQSASWVFK